jgi:ribosome-binding factor A
MRIRPERVAGLMRREIAAILEHKLRDPRIAQWSSVVDVEVTPDLAFARVFVSVLEGEPRRSQTLAALNKAAGFVRHELAPVLGLREVPELRFLLDDSIERGARVEDLLRKLEKGEPVDDVGEDE